MDGMDKVFAWAIGLLVGTLAITAVGSVADASAERARQTGKRERLELILKQMERNECAPLTIELVRELAK